MKSCRFIISGKNNASYNMALDEVLFENCVISCPMPVFRLYSWASRCITIGYFQKHADFLKYNIPVTRRLTGGLSVVHQNDLSYSFIVHESVWPYIYNQMKTYEEIHSGIKEGLSLIGENAQFYVSQSNFSVNGIQKHTLCVETFFPCDLHIDGRKIVGSSQRRRGKVLLVQGSIHINNYDFQKTAQAIMSGLSNVLGAEFIEYNPNEAEIARTNELIKKYEDKVWNEKF